jgi:hypothetical protein
MPNNLLLDGGDIKEKWRKAARFLVFTVVTRARRPQDEQQN